MFPSVAATVAVSSALTVAVRALTPGACNVTVPPTWPSTDAVLELSRLEPGRPVRTPEVLFKKIEDDQIAEWTLSFGGATEDA